MGDLASCRQNRVGTLRYSGALGGKCCYVLGRLPDSGLGLINSGLFTLDFLIEGIRDTDLWRALTEQRVEDLRTQALALFERLGVLTAPTEAVTEKDLIYPLLSAIGWGDLVFVQPNASTKGRADVPDALLFADEPSLALAKREREDFQRFQHGVAVVEAKRWDRALDREEKARKDEAGTPSSQMLRYLRRVDDVTGGRLPWGVLTNGRVWRLYFQGALSVAEGFLEIDLGKALDLPGCGLDLLDKRPDAFVDNAAWRDHAFRLFLMLFGREAFVPGDAGETFHTFALREGKFWEARVAKTLSATVFESAFPALADALAKADASRPVNLPPAYLDEVRQGSLILLYRLLFVLYAEDRNLLPDKTGPYAPYCLTRLRLDIAERMKRGGAFPRGIATFWPRLAAIFRAIAVGDDDLGIPPYNGGLFDPAVAPILGRVQLPDDAIAKVVFGLSHLVGGDGVSGAKYINYRDLSVQQLGSVYERILEFGLRKTSDGSVEPDADDEARHKSGSYYTPDELVSLIIARAAGPLIQERVAKFTEAAESLASDRRAISERLSALAAHDPAAAILSLKVCDPAMGSGHFLVSLVDWLADEVLASMAEATALVEWGDYVSPLASRIAAVRAKILGAARAHKWPIVESQLDDRHIVRRMVLKRVVYGVDKNPMAVELAKVALWLHSFTAGAPLSFLDHHLRAGDSVIGAWVRPTVDALQKRGALFNLGQIARVERVAGVMAEIEETTDNDVAEVASSKTKFGAVEEVTEPIAALFSLLTAEQMLGVFDNAPSKRPQIEKLEGAGKTAKQIERARAGLAAFERAAALQLVLEGTFGDPIRIASGAERVAPPELVSQLALLPEAPPDQPSLFPAISVDDRRRVTADNLVKEARALAAREGFLHWEIAFPNVWSRLASDEPEGGFDAVIGNPPYLRQELLGDEVKRALKKAYTVYDGMADLYVYFYEQGLKLLRPGGRMSYVVTNKWLKAGYAENLRDLFARRGWLEFVADFGHAKHFFPDADVFPSVLVVRKPDRAAAAPTDADVCVIPRDAVPRKGLASAVMQATFPLPRAMFTKESWVLEPKPVMDLLEKIRRNGVVLMEYVGSTPLSGLKTGLNRAYVVDRQRRDRLVLEDSEAVNVISPMIRGQDVDRWWSPPTNMFIILLKSSANCRWPWSDAEDENTAEEIFARSYPSIYKHMKQFETWIDPESQASCGLRHRDDQGRYWWELRSNAYYERFSNGYIAYQDIAYYPSFELKVAVIPEMTAFCLPSNDRFLLATLNSPLMWYYMSRKMLHGKDEALRLKTDKMQLLPIARHLSQYSMNLADSLTTDLEKQTRLQFEAGIAILDWLRHEFDLDKPGAALSQPHTLDADAFADAVRKALPKSQKLSAADFARLKQEHAATVEPARRAATQALALERQLSDLVNAAYGLTPDEVELMWATAPPRMPFERQ
jgi:hypothetical protein